jgi:hypothetical protein
MAEKETYPLGHDLIRKPVPTPDRVEGKLFGIMP